MLEKSVCNIRIDQIIPGQKDLITAELAKNPDVLRLMVPLFSFGAANSNISIAEDYLDALYVGESIYPRCRQCSVELEEDEPNHRSYAAFSVVPDSVHDFVETVYRLAAWFNSEEFPEDEVEEIREEVADMRLELPFRPVHFVELADSYMINLIWGLGGEEIENFFDGSVEEWEHYFPNQPECRFGYALSAITHEAKGKCFASIDDWVLESHVPITMVFTNHGPVGSSSQNLVNAQLLRIGESEIVTNGVVAVRLVREKFKNPTKMLVATGKEPSASLERFELSVNGDVLITYLTGRKIVQLEADQERLGEQQLREFLNRTECNAELLRSCLGHPTSVRFDWESLSDDIFELLCCEVLCRSGHYDPETLRKMGLSRSRDGGRDIVVKSKAWPGGRRPRLFIFQCKRIAARRSLSGSAVSVADVVDQYGARGFGVMTSAVIDSTLYDKLDGIAKNRDVKIDTWDKLRLERFISLPEHFDIRGRYFSSARPPEA